MKLQSDMSPSMCPDGYVRLSEHGLAQVQLVHASSGVDDALLAELRVSAIDAFSAGYTEWQSTRFPGSAGVSIGWDWYLDRWSGALLIVGSYVRSNIMVVDIFGADIGMAGTEQAILRRLARLNWSSTVASVTPLYASFRNGPTFH
jgi:hypothetical protein